LSTALKWRCNPTIQM